jgi:predicted enzyme related to lactoylglutathione lyase
LTHGKICYLEIPASVIDAAGGQLLTPFTEIGPGGDAFATFRDPAGNVVGLYQGPER